MITQLFIYFPKNIYYLHMMYNYYIILLLLQLSKQKKNTRNLKEKKSLSSFYLKMYMCVIIITF